MVYTRGHLATKRCTGIAPATSRYIGNGHGIHRGRTCSFFANRTRRLRIGPLGGLGISSPTCALRAIGLHFGIQLSRREGIFRVFEQPGILCALLATCRLRSFTRTLLRRPTRRSCHAPRSAFT